MSNQPSPQLPSNNLEIIVLAAGQGTRMNSRLPKVLHTLAGRPLLAHVLDRVAQLNPQRIHVVVGFLREAVRESVQTTNPGLEVNWVEQAERNNSLGPRHSSFG